MDKRRIEQIKIQFDNVIQVTEAEQIEFWYARDLMKLLGYSRWENFAKAIERAIESCETSQVEVLDHFREVTKMVAKTVPFGICIFIIQLYIIPIYRMLYNLRPTAPILLHALSYQQSSS